MDWTCIVSFFSAFTLDISDLHWCHGISCHARCQLINSFWGLIFHTRSHTDGAASGAIWDGVSCSRTLSKTEPTHCSLNIFGFYAIDRRQLTRILNLFPDSDRKRECSCSLHIIYFHWSLEFYSFCVNSDKLKWAQVKPINASYDLECVASDVVPLTCFLQYHTTWLWKAPSPCFAVWYWSM